MAIEKLVALIRAGLDEYTVSVREQFLADACIHMLEVTLQSDEGFNAAVFDDRDVDEGLAIVVRSEKAKKRLTFCITIDGLEVRVTGDSAASQYYPFPICKLISMLAVS